jgi:hypothetical protein
MTTLTAARQRNAGAWRPRGTAGWIGLAASPTFALMAWIAATDAPRIAICSLASGMLPIDGMAWMYLLMSLFNVSPWLKLASDRPRQRTHPAPQNCHT